MINCLVSCVTTTRKVKFVVGNDWERAEPGACTTTSFDAGPYVAPAAESDDAPPRCRTGHHALRVIVRNGVVKSAKQDLG